jgi:hypothetical protein
MPQTKEQAREQGKRGVQERMKHQQDLWDFIASGGARKYHELIDRQLDGYKVNKEQEKAMDRVERLFPYVKSKAVLKVDAEVKIVKPLLDVRDNHSNRENKEDEGEDTDSPGRDLGQ